MNQKQTGNAIEQYNNEMLIYLQYKNIALNRFQWEGLPEAIDERYVEGILYENGIVAIVYTENEGYMALPCHPVEKVNVNGEFTKYRVVGHNAFNKEFDIMEDNPNIVIIRNNRLQVPTRPYIEIYAKRLNQIERTLDVNISQQKTPYIVKVAKTSLLSFKNLFKKVNEDEPLIYADKMLDMNAIEVFPTVAPFIGIEMMDYKNQVKNELLSFLGINNANTDKKERLLNAEVNSNNEFVDENFKYMIYSRQEGAKKCQQVFGFTLRVTPRKIEGVDDIGTDNIDNKTITGE